MSKSAKKPVKKKAATKKKTVAKKSAKKNVKKTAAKKSTTKKAAKKKVVKKVAVKKIAKKAAAKKTVSKKKEVKKVVKKAIVKKAAVKKTGPKKVIVKTPPVVKTAVEKTEEIKPVVAKAEVIKPTVKAQVVKKLTEKHSELPGGIIVKTPRAESVSTNPNPRPALLNAIIEGLEERKAHNIVVLDLHKINNRSFDYFVIADADSSTHVEAIASTVEEEVKKKISERPYHTEGWQNAEWILLDYVNIVVHVFQKTIRDFYNIEDLWADAEMQKIN